MYKILICNGYTAAIKQGDAIYLQEFPPGEQWLGSPESGMNVSFHFNFIGLCWLFGIETANNMLISLCRKKGIKFVLVPNHSEVMPPSTFTSLHHSDIYLVCLRDGDYLPECLKATGIYYAPFCDFVITDSRKAHEFYSQGGTKSYFYNPKPKVAPIEAKREIDIAFIGEYAPVRDAVFSRLKREGFDIRAWGPGWSRVPGLFGGDIGRTRCLRTGQVEHGSIPDIYSRTKIVIDVPDRGVFQSKAHLTYRVFEASQCGAMVITPDGINIKRYFRPGESIVFYQDTNDLIGKLNYYLQNTTDRRLIADKGREAANRIPDMEAGKNEIWDQIARETEYAGNRSLNVLRAKNIAGYLRAVTLQHPQSEILLNELKTYLKEVPLPELESLNVELDRLGISYSWSDNKEHLNISYPNNWPVLSEDRFEK